MLVYTVEIKGNQTGLVTFHKIFFYVQQKNVVWNEMMTEYFLAVQLEINALLPSVFICDRNTLLSVLH